METLNSAATLAGLVATSLHLRDEFVRRVEATRPPEVAAIPDRPARVFTRKLHDYFHQPPFHHDTQSLMSLF
jgi:hypothetical protein